VNSIARMLPSFRPLTFTQNSPYAKSTMKTSLGVASFSTYPRTSLPLFISQIMPPSSQRREALSEVTSAHAHYIDLPIATEAKSEFQKKFTDLLRHYMDVSVHHPSTGYFYQHYSDYKQSVECPLPAVFMAILKMEYNCERGSQFVGCCESIFLKAAKELPSIGMKRLFYFHFIFHAAKLVDELRSARVHEVPNPQHLLFVSVADTLRKISDTLLTQISGDAMSENVSQTSPGYSESGKKYAEFLTRNPKTQRIRSRLLPDGVAQDLFPVSDRYVTCSGRAIIGTLDRIGLVYGAVEIAEKHLLSSQESSDKNLLLSALFSYYDHAKYSPQYVQDPTSELRWIDGLSLPFLGVNRADLNALVVHSDNLMSDLCEHKKSPATAYIKFEKGLSKTTLSREKYLSLITLMYQCHRVSLENMLIQDGLVDITNSLFKRDTQGEAIFSSKKNRFLWASSVAADFSLFSSYALSGRVPASAPVFVGYYGTIKEHGEMLQKTGRVNWSGSLGDQDLGVGMYMTPCVSVAQRFAISAIGLNVLYSGLPTSRIVPAVFAVSLPFFRINIETGLPKNTFFYNYNRDNGLALASHTVVHNPSIRGFDNVAELRINQVSGISLTPCPISADFFKGIGKYRLASAYNPSIGIS